MMVTVTLDEITANATKAALDERVARLRAAIDELETRSTTRLGSFVYEDVPVINGRAILRDGAAVLSTSKVVRVPIPAYVYDEDRDRAITWNVAALHETEQAREAFSDPDVEWSESELAQAYGK